MRPQLAYVLGVIALTGWASGAAGQDHDHAAAGQHEAGTHKHAEAAKLKNPVKSTPATVATGKALYDKQCASCHGESGKGDGKMAASLTGPKPSDITDATWKHGPSDGEIFTLISEGAKQTGMRGFASRMKTEDIWNVVTYLRTLAPTPPTPH